MKLIYQIVPFQILNQDTFTFLAQLIKSSTRAIAKSTLFVGLNGEYGFLGIRFASFSASANVLCSLYGTRLQKYKTTVIVQQMAFSMIKRSVLSFLLQRFIVTQLIFHFLFEVFEFKSGGKLERQEGYV